MTKKTVKVVCPNCCGKIDIKEGIHLINLSKEMLEIQEKTKTCENCGHVFQNETEKNLLLIPFTR
jgi:uncharacterized Zn finger protein